VPGSDTGAFEMAMWTMLGARGVTTLAWESFGEGWVTDAVKQLKLEPTVLRADYGQLPDLSKVDFADDVLFTWNGTTSGVRVPDGEWIPRPRRPDLCRRDQRRLRLRHSVGQDRRGHLLVAEGAGRRRRAWRADPRPPRGRAPGNLHPVLAAAQGVPPGLQGQAGRRRVQGRNHQHPSMLAVEDAIFALEWAKSVGGLEGLKARCTANAHALDKIVAERSWLGHLAVDSGIRSRPRCA
jgi:phosphoserine aminotransferase